MQLPIDERHTYTKEFLLKNLIILFGGRAAEELVLQQTTTGAGNDLEKATELARRMICEWGMSEAIGPMTVGKQEEQVFLGRDFNNAQEYSEQTAQAIDNEVRTLVKDSYSTCKKLLQDNIHLLHLVAERLLEREVLDGAEIDEIIRAAGESGGNPLSAAGADTGA